jgi:hypothetical protein
MASTRSDRLIVAEPCSLAGLRGSVGSAGLRRRVEVPGGERSFGRIKDDDGEKLGTKGSIRMVGRARIMLLRVIGYMKQDLRLLRAFAERPKADETDGSATRAQQREETADQLLDQYGVNTSTPPT